MSPFCVDFVVDNCCRVFGKVRNTKLNKMAKYHWLKTSFFPGLNSLLVKSMYIAGIEIIKPVLWCNTVSKIEKILKGSKDSSPSPLPSLKIQIMGRKVCLRCKSKTLLGIVNKLFVFKSLLTTSSNVLPLHLSRPWFEFSLKVKEGDRIQSRLPS